MPTWIPEFSLHGHPNPFLIWTPQFHPYMDTPVPSPCEHPNSPPPRRPQILFHICFAPWGHPNFLMCPQSSPRVPPRSAVHSPARRFAQIHAELPQKSHPRSCLLRRHPARWVVPNVPRPGWGGVAGAVALTTRVPAVMDGSLPTSLKHIISNAEYYGPSLFLLGEPRPGPTWAARGGHGAGTPPGALPALSAPLSPPPQRPRW